MPRYQTFREFWPFYVFQHLKAGNRVLHFIGTSIVLGLSGHWLWVASILMWSSFGRFWLGIVTLTHFFLMLLGGYGFAWAGHYFVEKNKPATFQYPLWSLMGDFKMYRLMWQRKMIQEVYDMKVHKYVREHSGLMDEFNRKECP